MEKMHRLCQNDRFAAHAGIELLEAAEGKARARMALRPEHLNAMNLVHGAAIFTLADLVFAMASNSRGRAAVAINAHISFLKAATLETGTLFAEATEVSRNAKLASYTVRVTDARDDLIAIFQGMVYRKKEKIDVDG